MEDGKYFYSYSFFVVPPVPVLLRNIPSPENIPSATNIFKFTRYFYKLAQINLSSARTYPEVLNTHDTFHHCLSTIDILVNSGKIQIRNTVHSTT